MLVYRDANSALLVYQLISADLSPAMYQMSSTMRANDSRDEGMLGGRAFMAIAWEWMGKRERERGGIGHHRRYTVASCQFLPEAIFQCKELAFPVCTWQLLWSASTHPTYTGGENQRLDENFWLKFTQHYILSYTRKFLWALQTSHQKWIGKL